MRGEFLELVPHERIVFSFGWEPTDGAPAIAPGSTRVEVTLTAADGDTIMRLRHTGIPAAQADEHRAGWAHFLPLLDDAGTGRRWPRRPCNRSRDDDAADEPGHAVSVDVGQPLRRRVPATANMVNAQKNRPRLPASTSWASQSSASVVAERSGAGGDGGHGREGRSGRPLGVGAGEGLGDHDWIS